MQGEAKIGPGKRLKGHRRAWRRAPPPRSSAGWPITPASRAIGLFICANTEAAPSTQVMFMSCPQACITGTSLPCASLVVTVLA